MRIASALASGLLLAMALLGGAIAGAEPRDAEALPPAAADPEAWTLRADRDGIVVHTRPVADSPLLAFRGATRLQAPLRQVVALIADGRRAIEWIDRTAESRPIAAVSESEGWIYTRTDLPWPVSDRDGITHWQLSQDEAGAVTIVMRGVPDYEPAREDCIRIPRSSGRWLITPLADGGVEVVFEHHNDPGGRVPGWLANTVVVEIPLKTLGNLRRVLAKESPPIDVAGFEFVRDPVSSSPH